MQASERGAGSAPRAPQVAFVCTANRARSPFAAALLRRHLEGTDVVVESLGTLEQRGAPALLPAVRSARAFGIDLRDHRARALSRGALREFDLVVGFEPLHVASAVVTGGAERARAFLLPELADALLLGTPDEGSFQELLQAAAARRNADDRFPRSLADPVGHSERRFLELYREIDRLVAILAMRLFSASGERTG